MMKSTLLILLWICSLTTLPQTITPDVVVRAIMLRARKHNSAGRWLR